MNTVNLPQPFSKAYGNFPHLFSQSFNSQLRQTPAYPVFPSPMNLTETFDLFISWRSWLVMPVSCSAGNILLCAVPFLFGGQYARVVYTGSEGRNAIYTMSLSTSYRTVPLLCVPLRSLSQLGLYFQSAQYKYYHIPLADTVLLFSSFLIFAATLFGWFAMGS
jgi:hypothetical protein